MLGADVVVEGDFGEGMRVGCVGGGGGLAVSEEGGDDYEKLGRMFNGGILCLLNWFTFFGFSALSSPMSQILSDIAREFR